mgnify:CR=1 FL=1
MVMYGVKAAGLSYCSALQMPKLTVEACMQ